MPTYHYRCPACETEFEEFQSMTEPPVDKCPKCGAVPKRLISGGAGLLFKGSGFYITDYRSSGYRSDAKKDQPAKSEPPAKKKEGGSKPDST
jgi:putative FmdB family regulatory protein